ncbi:putative repressor of RNA polymerase III transcription MAF1-like [Apostichopus japonicus]|uniref:Repressor of RNA polymerase III transcription MAF1 homolog n=1 Tax=Stichopus japonicus TaxID=307972 RepID=A0A2G8KRU8_STIJA|nr:putative repressor of RNA polymerase III transcription MAF1-like [Apostichopus japonicus]
MSSVDSNMFSVAGELYGSQIRSQLWTAINAEIIPQECEIYSYNPDLASDPYGEQGILWSFNYFFYNKKLKRILFFTCRAASKSSLVAMDSGLGNDLVDMVGDLSEDEEYGYDDYPTYSAGQRLRDEGSVDPRCCYCMDVFPWDSMFLRRLSEPETFSRQT